MNDFLFAVRCLTCGKRIPNCEDGEDFAALTVGHRQAYHKKDRPVVARLREFLEEVESSHVVVDEEMVRAEREHYEGHATLGDDASAISVCKADACRLAVHRWPLLALLTEGPNYKSPVLR